MSTTVTTRVKKTGTKAYEKAFGPFNRRVDKLCAKVVEKPRIPQQRRR